MVVASNIAAFHTKESLTNNKHGLNKTMEKIASGKQINAAGDNSSGLAIADKLRTQVSSINQSIDNAVSGVMLTQIADKAINEQSKMLDTIKQKLIQAKTATTSDEGRKSIAKDIKKLIEQIDEIASTTNYNGNYLLQKSQNDTSASSELEFQVGELNTNTIDLESEAVQSNSIGLELTELKEIDIDALTQDVAGENMAVIDEAINKANLFRSDFGMVHNQLKAASRNLRSESVNLSNAESVIRDTKYSEESAKFSKHNIVAQTGSFAMSQATKTTEQALKVVDA